MQILLVSATELEIAPFLDAPSQAYHLVTGVGVAATVYKLSKHLASRKYDLIIQAGIAGSFTDLLPPGEIACVKREVFADAGAVEKGRLSSLFDMGFAEKDEWPYSNGWLENRHELLQNLGISIVDAITVSTATDEQHVTDRYREKYNPSVESMEGAAFHYVCLQEKIPFLQIRAISNYVGERDKSKWKMKEAIENLNSHCKRIIAELSQVDHPKDF